MTETRTPCDWNGDYTRVTQSEGGNCPTYSFFERKKRQVVIVRRIREPLWPSTVVFVPIRVTDRLAVILVLIVGP